MNIALMDTSICDRNSNNINDLIPKFSINELELLKINFDGLNIFNDLNDTVQDIIKKR